MSPDRSAIKRRLALARKQGPLPPDSDDDEAAETDDEFDSATEPTPVTGTNLRRPRRPTL
jgi:hypothetical protein